MIIKTKYELGEKLFNIHDKKPALYTVQTICVTSDGIAYLCEDDSGVCHFFAEGDLV